MPVERIENLPAGVRLFLDANIFVYAFLGHSNQCRELLGRCATEQVLGITTLDVVSEVTHRMMLAEALGSGLIKRNEIKRNCISHTLRFGLGRQKQYDVY